MLPFLALALASLPAAPPCRAAQLALSTDARDGDFNGMSHSGTALILRNRGRRACTLPALPPLRFVDARGNTIPTARNVPPGLHPGPVMLPVRVAPGAAVETGLRWVSGEVYDHSRCADPAAIAVPLGRATLRAPLAAHLCGDGAKPIGIDQPPLAPPQPR